MRLNGERQIQWLESLVNRMIQKPLGAILIPRIALHTMRFWIYVLVVCLAGCSAQSMKHSSVASIFSFIDNSRLQLNMQALSDGAIANGLSEKQFIKNSLLHSSDERLLPNDDFDYLTTVASQKGADISDLYAEKLADFLRSERFFCSEPLFYNYFVQRYQLNAPPIECDAQIPFSIFSKNNEEKIIWLDPARVSEVHLLFAGSDEGLISRFGHVQLRLVVCPENDNSKEACDSNLYEHITIGYRAHVDEFNISTLKGLMGDYRAYLYAEDFMGSYRQYAIDEFRDMYSLPLKLSKTERVAFVKSLAEIHWSFSGDYKFLTRNCATLLQDALAISWPNYAKSDAMMNELYLRPDNFFEAMLEQPLTDSKALQDLALAERRGYFFSSTEPIYTKAFNQVHSEMSQVSFQSLDEYKQINPVDRYQRIQDDYRYLEKLKNDEVLLGAQLLIEEYGALKSRSRMNAGLANYFENNQAELVEKFMLQVLGVHEYRIFSDCILKPIQSRMSPKKRVNGIPSTKELIKVENIDGFDCQSDENWNSLQNINKQLEMLDESNWQTVNIAMFYWLESLNNVIRLRDLK